MLEFSITSKSYEKNLLEKRGAPVLKMGIMLDSNELRPESFTEAEEW